MQSKANELVGSRTRFIGDVLLYGLVLIQYIPIFSVLGQMRQRGPLSFGILLLPIVYLAPLVMGMGFKRHIGVLERKGSMSLKVANICKDWLTTILLSVYSILLAFRSLH